MAIKSAKILDKAKRIKIDLRGPDGNAFVLMGYGSKMCSQMGKEWEPIRKEMMSGDYENLIEVFDREFGMFVDLYR